MNAAPEGENENAEPFEWAIVEVFGHRRHAGRAIEVDRFGAKMLRIDIPAIAERQTDGAATAVSFDVTSWVSHFYGGSSIFSYTPSDETTVMRINRPYHRPQAYIEQFDDDDEDGELMP